MNPKTNISTIMAATALAAAGMPQVGNSYDEYTLSRMKSIAIGDHQDIQWSHLFRQSMPKMHQKNFKWRSQRQIRKNRRRANAAGVKNAHKK